MMRARSTAHGALVALSAQQRALAAPARRDYVGICARDVRRLHMAYIKRALLSRIRRKTARLCAAARTIFRCALCASRWRAARHLLAHTRIVLCAPRAACNNVWRSRWHKRLLRSIGAYCIMRQPYQAL